MGTNKKMTDQKKEMLFAELHSLLSSGLDFSRAFALLTGEESDGRVKALLGALFGSVVAGRTLWQSMEDSACFSSLDCGVIRIGEETGRLDEALAFLSAYYSKRLEQRRLIAGAVAYPLVILATAVIVLFFMIMVIVPMFEQVYARMGGELPAITRGIIALSRHFPLCLSVGGGIVLAGIGVWHFYGRTDYFRRMAAGLLLRLPGVGKMIRQNCQERFCRLLWLLHSSGIPLIQGLEMLPGIISFYPYRSSFPLVCRDIREGRMLADALAGFSHIYSPKLVTLIRVGEETNRLGFMLRKQADELNKDMEFRLRLLGHLLEPLLILLVGGIVAVVLIAMYMPMFKLGTVLY